MSAGSASPHVHIVGAGLIGTSVGAALASAGWAVTFADPDTERREAAAAFVARLGTRPVVHVPAVGEPAVVLAAAPPAVTADLVAEASRRFPTATVMDTASVKSLPMRQLAQVPLRLDNVVLSHPLAGSATSGPEGASSELFAGRTWALCRTPHTTPEHAARAEGLVRACGGSPTWLDADTHDRVVALTSHVPQFLASGLAASVAPFGEAALTLSGPALAEMTRVADSPAQMWAQIAAANAEFIGAGLDVVLGQLAGLRAALASGDERSIDRAVTTLMSAGRDGRALLARRHSLPAEPPTAVADARVWVEAIIPDRQGGLAAVFATAAHAQVNVEDVRLDHAPHAATGTVALAVAQIDAERLRRALADASSVPLDRG